MNLPYSIKTMRVYCVYPHSAPSALALFCACSLYLLAASQSLRDIATMMLETGMRPDEVCRVRRENVHLDQGYLFNPFGKTKAARRKVPLTEKACALLARRLEKVKGEFVFPGRATDQPIVKVNRAYVG